MSEQDLAPAPLRWAAAICWLGLLAVAPAVTVAWVLTHPRKKGGVYVG